MRYESLGKALSQNWHWYGVCSVAPSVKDDSASASADVGVEAGDGDGSGVDDGHELPAVLPTLPSASVTMFTIN